MSYSSAGRRPFESASKTNHIHIIKDKAVAEFLETHEFPKTSESIHFDEQNLINVDYENSSPIDHIIAVDGGMTTVSVKANFPSATLTFFQIGALYLATKDLKNLSEEVFISPTSISKLKDLERIKLVLPTKNIGQIDKSGNRKSITDSVREAIYQFFKKNHYLDTLAWFLFERYNKKEGFTYNLSSHPNNPDIKDIRLTFESLGSDFIIPHDSGPIFLTDVFRLHEAIDDDLGAAGINGYVINLIEQFVLIDTIRGIYRRSKNQLKKTIFIKDGPLAFFGQTAKMHNPMRNLINFLNTEVNLYLVGIEKSGAFVEHALEIHGKLNKGQALLLSNKHIYTYIRPGDPNTSEPYGQTSYFGSKVIFKSRDEKIYVLTIPTIDKNVVMNPTKNEFIGIDTILFYIEQLKSDLYDHALLPVALANKLVSLSDHPSSTLLEKFAKEKMRET
jgi:hypothetical protein